MTNSHQEAYKEEASEILADLENALVDLEKMPDDMDLIGRIFRAMHTIKGSGSMFGFDDIAALIHHVETAYDLIRNHKLQVTNTIIGQTLAVCDQVRQMLSGSGNSDITSGTTKDLIDSFNNLVNPAPPAEASAAAEIEETLSPALAVQEKSKENKEDFHEATYRIRFKPCKELFIKGTNPLLLLKEVLSLGSGKLIAQTDNIPLLDALDPESCYIYWDIILTTDKGLNAIRDVFIFIEDECELRIDLIDESHNEEIAEGPKKLGEILVERGDISADTLKQVLEERKLIGETLVELGLVNPQKIQSALIEQDHIKEQQQKRVTEQSSSIRVPADKLDHLVNMVGELVTVQSRLSQISSEQLHPELIGIAEEVERLVSELRDTTMSIRMLPIGTTFSKFKRLVHDLAGELGKNINLVTNGGDTELDKTVIERLSDPLVHLIRNSIDHGIETPSVRIAQGKPQEGTITLSAAHSGANVLIEIRDDGAGLNAEAIRAKAIDKGILSPDANIAERDLFAMIFQPGFSTAQTVTSVSGRGVGMDVVKRNIDALHGKIDISSQKGSGTTITLKLPLTLAIIDGLLVEIGEESFVMPLSAVEECVELKRSENGGNHGNNLIMIRGELLPYIVLRDLFKIPGSPPAIEQIVTTQMDGRRIGFVVDQVIGQHQTVIKSLGRMYQNAEEISGATILGNGSVVLILDLPKLIEKAERVHQQRLTAERIH
jgi:two-component system, chemotaxis family, sensor kinase CheA